MSTWTSLSHEIASAVSKAAPSVVQVHGHRRVAAGVVIADNVIVSPASTSEDTIAVRTDDGTTHDGTVLGRIGHMSLTVIRVDGLKRPPLPAAGEPRPGHLAVAVGRTWSGGIMATLAPIAVVGGPLRTGRTTSIDRVIRMQQSPHGALTGGALIDPAGHALGIITSSAIRGTTVVLPASLVIAAASQVAAHGGHQQGFIGVSSLPVALPERQRAGRAQNVGLLISHIAAQSPAEVGGLLVGDVIVGFAGESVQDADELITKLRGDRVGATVPITVIRGTSAVDVSVTVGQRPR